MSEKKKKETFVKLKKNIYIYIIETEVTPMDLI